MFTILAFVNFSQMPWRVEMEDLNYVIVSAEFIQEDT